MNLKQGAFSAIRWTTLAMCGRSAIQLIQLVVLARLLTPSDFGLMAMVVAVIAFVEVFSDFGVSSALIHHKCISENQLSSLYWLNVLVGFALMVLLILASHDISMLFNQPDLQPVLIVISVSLFLTAAGQQLRVVAEKALRFSILAKIEISAALAGLVIAIGWALYSPGVYALVASVLVNAFTQTVLLWVFSSEGWRPALRLRLGEIRKFLAFGSYIMGNNFINSINSQADILIAGRLFPADALGAYSLPRNFSLTVARFVNPIVTRVGLPIMARTQEDKIFLGRIYLRVMRMTASINFPIYMMLAIFSEEVILLVFGEKWHDSAPLLTLLAIWGMFRSCGNPVGSLLLAVGKADLSFRWNLALLFIVLPTLWISSRWGLMGLAAGQALLVFSFLVPAWYVLVRPHCGAEFREYLLSLASPFLCASLAVGVSYWVVSDLTAPLWRIVGAAMVAVPLYIAISYAFNRSWLSAMWQLLGRGRLIT